MQRCGVGRWRAAGGRWSYRYPGCGDDPRVAAALTDLGDMHERQHQWSVPGLIEEVLSRRFLRALAFDDWRPQEAHRRYRFVAEQARARARSSRPTLHDIVDHLERGPRPQLPLIVRDGAADEDCVRVMTVHAAKGLRRLHLLLPGVQLLPPRGGELRAHPELDTSGEVFDHHHRPGVLRFAPQPGDDDDGELRCGSSTWR